MAEHVTDVYERILREVDQNPVAPLDDVPLTPRMRTYIKRWYDDRAFLAKTVKRLYGQTEPNDVIRLRS